MQVIKHINQLPPELLERIFLMLDFKDRKSAVLVCRSVHSPFLHMIHDLGDYQDDHDDYQFNVDDNQVNVDDDQVNVDNDQVADQGGGRRWVRCQGCGAGFSLR